MTNRFSVCVRGRDAEKELKTNLSQTVKYYRNFLLLCFAPYTKTDL